MRRSGAASSLARSLVLALCEMVYTQEGEVRLWECLAAVTEEGRCRAGGRHPGTAQLGRCLDAPAGASVLLWGSRGPAAGRPEALTSALFVGSTDAFL